MKSREEIEKLKANWKHDPIWDLEETEGFEDCREELLQFSQDCKAQWAERNKKEHDRLAKKICPVMTAGDIQGGYNYCVVELCAFWNDNLGICGAIVQGHLAGIQVAREEAKG